MVWLLYVRSDRYVQEAVVFAAFLSGMVAFSVYLHCFLGVHVFFRKLNFIFTDFSHISDTWYVTIDSIVYTFRDRHNVQKIYYHLRPLARNNNNTN